MEQKFTHKIPLPQITIKGNIKAFLLAFAKKETYLPKNNIYMLFGFLWGCPIPFVTLGVFIVAKQQAFTIANVFKCVYENPWQICFLMHPIFFALVFSAMGTIALERKHKIVSLLQQLNKLAHTDGLTGLLNHRAFQEKIQTEIKRASRENKPLTLLLLDIDHFKKINDQHGHLGGDQVLQQLGQKLQQQVRPYDILCRYGGEEFAIVVPGLDEKAGEDIALRIRKNVAQSVFSIAANEVKITVSIGVASYQEEKASDWISRADKQLYKAKNSGRNRVCTSRWKRSDFT